MSTPLKYRCFLKAAEGTYYYVDNSGAVQTITDPINPDDYALKSTDGLPYEPVNWDEIELKWGRSETYFGVFRSVSSSIVFDDVAATICRHVYYSEGAEGELIFVLEERDGQSWDYNPLYQGKVDFYSAADEHSTFTVAIAEGGLPALVKSNENTPYELPINISAGALQVYHDGPELQADYLYTTFSSTQPGVIANQFFPIPVLGIDKDGDYTIGEQHDQQLMLMGNGAPAWSTNSAQHNNFCYRVPNGDENWYNTVEVTPRPFHDIDYTANGSNGSPVSLELHAVVADSVTGAISQDVTIYSDPGVPLNAGQNRRLIISSSASGWTGATLTLNPDDRLYYLFRLVPVTPISGTPKADFVFFGQQKFDVLIKFRLDATITEGFRAYQVADKLTNAFTGGAFTVHSDFLYDPFLSVNVVDSRPYNLVYTSGDAVRRLNTDATQTRIVDPVIRITLRDYFRDLFGRYCLGMGPVNDVLRIEPLTFFFDSATLIADLGEVTDLKIETASGAMFNQFKTGFSKQDTNKLNGKDAFNTTSVWKMPMTKMPAKEEDFSSPFVGDMYPIEQLRANLSQKKTTDSQNDNDTVLLEIDTTTFTGTVGGQSVTGAFRLRRQNNSGNTSGILSPAYAYNVPLTPARDLKRLGGYIHSIGWKRDSLNIDFQTSDRNKFLISNLGSGTVNESASVSVGSLDNIIFKPIKITFKAPPPLNLGSLMDSAAFGYFTATYFGKTIKIFATDVSYKPGKSAEQEWTGWATPDFDETQFYT
jgi:hypothetical protein